MKKYIQCVNTGFPAVIGKSVSKFFNSRSWELISKFGVMSLNLLDLSLKEINSTHIVEIQWQEIHSLQCNYSFCFQIYNIHYI